MQNLARFRTTSNFDGEYLQNGWRYSKSDKYSIDRDSSRVQEKSCLRRSTGGIISIPIDFIGRPFLALRGCCAPKFSHALENGQVLLAHPQREGESLVHFFTMGVKNWFTI